LEERIDACITRNTPRTRKKKHLDRIRIANSQTTGKKLEATQIHDACMA